MKKLHLVFALLISLILSNCSFLNKKQKTSEEIAYQVVIGQDYCYPLETDTFDHPIDKIPLDEPIASQTIWPRIQQGLLFHHYEHPRIREQLNWYRKNPKYINKVQQRSARYLFHITELLESKKMPLDFALLPVVESAFEPFAYSHGQASGLWQFIPITAKRFKLEHNWWADQRRNITQSTEAAINYLSYLYRYFDEDWLLALAAYNAGEGTVRKAIKLNQKKGKKTDFWHLKLPKETKAYVPKLIALSKLFNAPSSFNAKLLPIANEPYFSPVPLDFQLDIAQAADLMDISIDEIYYLNPELNQWATPPSKTYSINVPTNKKKGFEEKLNALPKSERVKWFRHTVFKGESLSVLAKTYNSNVNLIKSVNNLRTNKIIVGQSLIVPTALKTNDHYSKSQLNRIKSKQSKSKNSRQYAIYHNVKKGDSLWRIAKKYQVKINELTLWNNRSPKDRLQVGEKIMVLQYAKTTKRKHSIRKVHYKVRSGDSLSKISAKFNVGVDEILKWNDINPNKYLKKGHPLTLFVDVTQID